MHRAPATIPIILIAMASACITREVARLDPKPELELRSETVVNPNREIDILFVIDDSFSMLREQTSLAENFDRFVNVLDSIEGGRPSIHLGVVSTNIGGSSFIDGCTGQGDNGRLQNAPRVDGCSPPSDPYIVDLENDDGTRTTNYGGSLEETFSCIAQLGTAGCGFEQPFEAMRRALDGSNPENAGFLRDDAILAVIFITDEDDCSLSDEYMLTRDQDSIDSPLGYLHSFRCWEFGVKCEPDTDLRQERLRQGCTPRFDSDYVANPNDYVDFLLDLKSNPRNIIVAGIIGDTTPVIVGRDPQQPEKPALVPSCSSSAGEADPAIRIEYLLNAFPQTSAVTKICNEDLSGPLLAIADLIGRPFRPPCLEQNIDIDRQTPGVQSDCAVSDVQNLNQDNQIETPIAPCDDPANPRNQPCWHLIGDEEVGARATAAGTTPQYCCDSFETEPELCIEAENQTLIVERTSMPPTDTLLVARCRVLPEP